MIHLVCRKYAAFENALREQAEHFGGGVEMEFLEVEDLYERMVNKGTALRDDFDLMLVPGDFYPTMIHRGMLLNLEPMIRADPPQGWPDAWHPALMAYQTGRDGGIYGLPYHDGPEMLIYRRDLFKQNRIERPENWDTFLQAAQTLTDPAKDRWGCIVAAFPDAHNICYDFFLQLWSRSGEIVDEKGHPLFDDAIGAESLQYLLDLVYTHRVAPPESPGIDSVVSGQWFAEGRVAMMVNWMGFACWANESPDSAVRGKVATAPVPRGTGRLGRAVGLNNYWSLAITAGSRHAETAYSFIRHCTRAEMDRITIKHGCIGCRRDSWKWACEKEMTGYDQIAGALESARTLPLLPQYGPMGEIISEELGRAWRREVIAAEALSTAARRIREIQ